MCKCAAQADLNVKRRENERCDASVLVMVNLMQRACWGCGHKKRILSKNTSRSWNMNEMKEQERREKEQQHMQADLYNFCAAAIAENFLICCLTLTRCNDQVSRAKLNKKSLKKCMLIVKSVSYDHNCIVCEFEKIKYIFVIGEYFQLIDYSSSSLWWP